MDDITFNRIKLKVHRRQNCDFWWYFVLLCIMCWCVQLSICNSHEDLNLLQQFTKEERIMFFGDSSDVPTFAIIRPKLPTRRKRSLAVAPIPERLSLEALNQTFNFTLWPSKGLLADNFVMLVRRDNYTDIYDNVWNEAECMYQGTVERTDGKQHHKPDSVAVGMCDGMRGFITSTDEYYVISPLPKRFHKRSLSTNNEDSIPHIIWKRNPAKTVCRHRGNNYQAVTLKEHSRPKKRKRRYTPIYNYYNVADSLSNTGTTTSSGTAREDLNYDSMFRRERRQESYETPNHLYVETAVFVDRDLYKHMQINFPGDTEKEVARIVLTLVNAVEHLYNDVSLGYFVRFVLKRLEILGTDPPSLVRPYDIDHFLTSFCKWQRGENPANDNDPFHWDHALILTGLDLYVVNRNGKISNQVVGLAPVAGMCTRSSSCTVNEGRHFESVYVVAHEIGHNLGMRHDGPQADNDCDPASYIMSPTLGSGKITWSPCSRKYLEMFLETPQSRCLRDRSLPPPHLDHGVDGRLPGERFDSDKQCVLKYGRGSYHAPQQPLADVCRDLHCRREHYTWTSHPALEGTFCGPDMWCRAGRCVAKDSSVQPGYEPPSGESGWGTWSPFTECASGCLYGEDGRLPTGSTGIIVASRRCDSPRSHSGDQQCLGVDRRYKTCNAAKQCATVRRTIVQDYATEICGRASEVDTELTGKGYQSVSTDAERSCAVWCQSVNADGPKTRSGWYFPDGTSCQIEGIPSTSYCVNGRCQEFSCNPLSTYYHDNDDGSCLTHASESNTGLGMISATGSSSAHGGLSTFDLGDDDDVYPQSVTSHNWSRWSSSSPCRFGCLAPARGLQLVTRECRGNSLASSYDSNNSNYVSCPGLATSVKLCRPDKPGCSRLKTPFEFATTVCSKYLQRVSGLSGLGMQLSPSHDDPDRPCKVACQDDRVSYRFYMVNGEDGWFPSGTDCSRGVQSKHSFCLGGRCVDFGEDETPLYRPEYNIQRFERLFKRSLMINSTRIGGSLDETLLRQIIQKLDLQGRNITFVSTTISGVDFNNPVHISELPPGSHTIEAFNFIPMAISRNYSLDPKVLEQVLLSAVSSHLQSHNSISDVNTPHVQEPWRKSSSGGSTTSVRRVFLYVIVFIQYVLQ